MGGLSRVGIYCIDGARVDVGKDPADHARGVEVEVQGDCPVAEDVGIDFVAQLGWEVEKWVDVGFPGRPSRAGQQLCVAKGLYDGVHNGKVIRQHCSVAGWV